MWILDRINELGDRAAVISENRKYTYKDLSLLVQKYYKIVVDAIPNGKIVAVVGRYDIKSIAIFFSLIKNKNIIIPITTEIAEEIKYQIANASAEFVIWVSETENRIKKIKNKKISALYEQLINKNRPGLVLFSSGSTGSPKGMLHDLYLLGEGYKKKRTKNINIIAFMYYDHIGGIDTLFRAIAIGGTVTIPMHRTTNEICQLISKYKVDVLPTSPTFLNLLLISGDYLKYNLSSLKIIGFGAEPMPETLLKRLNLEFPEVKLQQKFGISETNAIRVVNKDRNSLFIKIEDNNIEYKIVENELWIKSKSSIIGYIGIKTNSFTNDGWFKTGDIIELDNDGYFKIIGRKSEVINVGGEKVFPTEIESFLLKVDGIEDCLVYGEKNSIIGMHIAADVVAKCGIDLKSLKRKIRKECSATLDGYKMPTKINFVQEIKFGQRYKKLRRK